MVVPQIVLSKLHGLLIIKIRCPGIARAPSLTQAENRIDANLPFPLLNKIKQLFGRNVPRTKLFLSLPRRDLERPPMPPTLGTILTLKGTQRIRWPPHLPTVLIKQLVLAPLTITSVTPTCPYPRDRGRQTIGKNIHSRMTTSIKRGESPRNDHPRCRYRPLWPRAQRSLIQPSH